MTQKLYVGGLSYNSTEETLKLAFSVAGTVISAIIIMDKMTGRSRGFGFVEMSSEEEAEKAIEMLNDTEVDGRRISVNKARPQENNGGFRSNSGSRSQGGYNSSAPRDRKW